MPLAPEPIEPLPAPAPEPAPKPAPAPDEDEEEAEEAEAQTLKGTVVHANPAAGSYAMAIKGGELVSVHAAELPEPGTKLSVPLRPPRQRHLRRGRATSRKRRSKATEATFRGAVTFTDPDPAAPAYTVSGRGASLLVHVEPDPSGAGAAPQLPAIGAYVTVTAGIEESEHSAVEAEGAAQSKEPAAASWQRELELEPGPPSTYLDLAGIVKEVLPDTNQLLLSADDTRESDSRSDAHRPEVDRRQRSSRSGDSYLATATVEPDGTLTLSGIASDEHTKGANDPASAQGDLKR